MARKIHAESIIQPVKDCLIALAADIAAVISFGRVQLLNSGALAIKAGASAIVKIGAAIYATATDATGAVVLVTKAINTDMAALAGTVTNAKFNVYCFFIDSAGTLTTSMGTEGATLATVVFPTFSAAKTCIGFVIINPTGTGNFVGGTTALDDATVVPNAVYVNTVGAFRPTTAPTISA